jgi:outer membrane protein OmpA-like peptidoglycan-associated protein
MVGAASGNSSADPVGRHFELVPAAGYMFFDRDLEVGGHALSDVLYVGGRLAYELRPSWALEAAGGYAPTRDASNGASVDFFHYSGNLVWTPWAAFRGGPFAFVGGGEAQLKPVGSSSTHGSLEAGGGARLWFTDGFAFRLEARNIMTSGELGSRKSNLVLGAGLVYALGARARDTDGDGVPDSEDKCPATPHGAIADLQGCPKDSDHDGVLDGLDRCPGTPQGAIVDLKGCPSDSDGDGVLDGLDQCAGTPQGATVDAKGCPRDTDGDGVLDGLDQCPGTPQGATVDEKGCPKDSDGDGVLDGLDQCPDTAPGLKVDEHGCVIEYLEKESEMLDTGMIRLTDVQFEVSGSVLQPSFHSLDLVGQTFEHWPQLRIEIGGHTDAHGGAAKNQKLSEVRADSVRAYLMTKFPTLRPGQFTVKGYGMSQPLVPSDNEINMQKNRRVEFKVINKELLIQEAIRRGHLEEGAAPADTTRR